MVEEAVRGPVAVGRLMPKLVEIFGHHPAHQVPPSPRSRGTLESAVEQSREEFVREVVRCWMP